MSWGDIGEEREHRGWTTAPGRPAPQRMPSAGNLLRHFPTPPSSFREGGTLGQPLPCLGIEDAKVSGQPVPRSQAWGVSCSLPLPSCPRPGTHMLKQSGQHWDQTVMCVNQLQVS